MVHLARQIHEDDLTLLVDLIAAVYAVFLSGKIHSCRQIGHVIFRTKLMHRDDLVLIQIRLIDDMIDRKTLNDFLSKLGREMVFYRLLLRIFQMVIFFQKHIVALDTSICSVLMRWPIAQETLSHASGDSVRKFCMGKELIVHGMFGFSRRCFQ